MTCPSCRGPRLLHHHPVISIWGYRFASQANYTAGGTFQDAIARRRAARGLPCITVDLGMVDGVGYVAENKACVAERLIASGHRQLA